MSEQQSPKPSWYDRAAVIPGRSLTRSKAPGRLYPVGTGPHYVLGGDGAELLCEDGRRYLDTLCAHGAISLGYNSAEVGGWLRLSPQLYSLPHVNEVLAAEAVLEHIAPWATHVRFVKTGSEATHAAYRIAKRATGRAWVLIGDWCYDDETEVLTSAGWRLFKDVPVGTHVATRAPNGDLQYQSVTASTMQQYSGQMFEFKGTGLDLCVSPNHNILCGYEQKDGSVEWKLTTARKAANRKKRVLMTRSANAWEGRRFDCGVVEIPSMRNTQTRRGVGHATKDITTFRSRDFAEFLGTYIAEGFRQKRKKRAAYQVVVCQKRGYKFDRIAALVDAMGFKANRKERHVSFNSKDLWFWLARCGDGAMSKRVPRVIIEYWGADRLRVVLEAMIDGDGTRKKNHSCATYYTASKELADDVQELALKCGYAAVVRCRRQTRKTIGSKVVKRADGMIYSVSIIRDRKTTSCAAAASKHYDGLIYCVSVPNRTLYVRRNGKAVWSGNSYHGWHEWCERRPDRVTESFHTILYGHGADLATLMGHGVHPLNIDPDEVAAVFVEPHRWEDIDVGWLRSIRSWCDKAGALLVFDEMIYGGRWALGGAAQYFGVTPDLACYGKALGNGMPIAFVVGREALAEHGGLASGTYSGEAVTLQQVVNVLAEYRRCGVVDWMWARGLQLQLGLRALCAEHQIAVPEGSPVHQRLRFQTEAEGARFSQEMVRRGIIWHPACCNIMLAHTEAHIELVLVAAEGSLRAMAREESDVR